jgi:6-phosphofructokinase
VAMATRDTGRDTEAMGPESPIKILEVMGRNAGWLTASAALARQEEGDPPHLVYVPERPVSVEQLIRDVEGCYREHEYVVIAMSEGAQESPGRTLGEAFAPKEVDVFGHRMKGGVSDFAATLLGGKLGLKVRLDKPNYLQRSLMACASTVDLEEAHRVGRQAVKEAVSGCQEGMVTLVRDPGPGYHSSSGEDAARRVHECRGQLPQRSVSGIRQAPGRGHGAQLCPPDETLRLSATSRSYKWTGLGWP